MYYFIVNPNAGSRKGMRFWEEIKKYLMEEGIDFREMLTRGQGDAERYVRRITRRHCPDVITVVGGDGTLQFISSAPVPNRMPAFCWIR